MIRKIYNAMEKGELEAIVFSKSKKGIRCSALVGIPNADNSLQYTAEISNDEIKNAIKPDEFIEQVLLKLAEHKMENEEALLELELREDRLYIRGNKKYFSDAEFYGDVKEALAKMNLDVEVADPSLVHMTSTTIYLVAIDESFCFIDGSYAIRDTITEFNRQGETWLSYIKQDE